MAPSTGTRRRKNRTADNLPPPRSSKSLASVAPPLATTRLHRFIYALALLSILLVVYYAFRITKWKSQVGAWGNLPLWKTPPQAQVQTTASAKAAGETVEDRINALAEALGMPSRELASAIAGAVREYVPPASLSSIKAEETGVIVEELVRGAEGIKEKGAGSESA